MDQLERIFIRFAYFLVFSLLFAPLSVVGMYLAEHYSQGSLAHAAGAVLAITWAVLVIGLSYWATARFVSGDTFGKGIGSAFEELRLRLAFLPVVGRLFAPRK